MHVYGSLTVGKAGVSENHDLKMWPSTAGRSVMGWQNVDNYMALKSGDPLLTELFTVTTGGRGVLIGGLTVNEDSSSAEDFRVESDSSTHAFFVDASTNNLTVQNSTSYGHDTGVGIDLNYDGTIYAGSTYWAGGLRLGTTFYSQSTGDYYKLSSRYAVQYRSNSQGGNHIFNTADTGTADAAITWREQANFGRLEAVFNDGGDADLDFRVESDNNSSMFFVDASNDSVEISKAQSGASALTVVNSSSNGSNVGAMATSLDSTSNNTNCWHLKSTTQTISSYYLYGDGSSSFTSDERLKTDIVDVEAGQLDKLNAVRFVNFKWKNSPDSPKQMGVIAQEIEKIFPDVVNEDEDAVGTGETYKSVSYSKLNMIALKAIQELSAKVETLEARIAALESN